MLFRVFILYLESLLITALLVGSFLGLWIGLRAVRRVDKTVRDRRAHLYDMLLIAVMTIPILSFAMMGILLVLKA
ncbi:DUF4059 family protein [Streptococcus constellatus]|uniref:Amino acid transporter, AAT family n=1 Tax=Streptococcus constellatus subsp. constellatus SK53 TaxID=1095730 RepID=A0AAD2SVI0_STRCV|nr:DUF4059 family protein [Streptococcus constellatus]EID20333.1 hypothetical protein HMPREF1044_1186 [Streptococcus constellatus subsp. constellatus SK53]MDP1485707.1 DUF4059 family protein [Streptococcus constellatus]QQT05484.1 DUF4059 family protein [Streptococcus constellatus]SUN40011.1 membrane associated protein [Streptococcus constellatus]BBD22070.1 hypothetical protein SCSC_0391 [Streptococcus constellatus subsp. constellatus]